MRGRKVVGLPVTELAERYHAGESAATLGRAYGVCRMTVANRLHAAGVKMRPSGTGGGPRLGSKNKPKRGGPLFVTRGYLITYDREHRQCFVHRGCWEAHYGPIPNGHIVHHTDGDCQHNAIGNLACMTPGDHNRLHYRMRKEVNYGCI